MLDQLVTLLLVDEMNQARISQFINGFWQNLIYNNRIAIEIKLNY